MKLVDEAARRLAEADLQTNYWVEAGREPVKQRC